MKPKTIERGGRPSRSVVINLETHFCIRAHAPAMFFKVSSLSHPCQKCSNVLFLLVFGPSLVSFNGVSRDGVVHVYHEDIVP